MSQSFADMLEESLAQTELKPGALIRALVLSIDNDYVLVNAGLKSEGLIPTREFIGEDRELEIKVGDEVDVTLELVEDGYGETILSREKARLAAQWVGLEKSFEAEEAIDGLMSEKVKGGFTVMIGDIRAFLPGSLVDVRPVRDTAHLEGRVHKFKCIKLDRKRNNVVVSRRAVLEADLFEEREALMENLEEGQAVKGIVKNLTDYGAFVDLGGLDGLLHITDMAWRRVRHPSEIVNVGDEIDVRILKFDRERVRVSLGLKQLGEDPWLNISSRYPVATKLVGSVTNVTDYGCFVELEEGVEGLVHMSEMDWTNRNVQPGKMVQIGDQIEVMILEIDSDRRRISLGMKQCKVNPWEEFSALYKKGDKISGAIKSITDFGIFVELSGSIDGLVHLSDISWDVAGEEAIRNFKKGDEVEAVVQLVDANRERISLSIKDLETDPVMEYMNRVGGKNTIVTGVVKDVDAKIAVITLAEGVEGVLKAADISRERTEDVTKVMRIGDEVEAKIVGIDNRSRDIQLSIRAKDEQEESEAISSYRESSSTSTTNLGELLKQQLDQRDS
ncbi:MAG: 30S ribosomal protein S1 [Immundisolibacteraceae bacterium]|nr:30S ribosomal protein S1 [Immundisolibacteraceae bacterium]